MNAQTDINRASSDPRRSAATFDDCRAGDGIACDVRAADDHETQRDEALGVVLDVRGGSLGRRGS